MYQILSDTMIIDPNFNQSLQTINQLDKINYKKKNSSNIISTIIFSNFKDYKQIEFTENKCLCLDPRFIRNKFNHPIDYLPPTITHLVLGGKFNNKINNSINSLQFVEFYGEYNLPLDDLPDSIREIKICGWDFNQPIRKLPCMLLYLNFVGTSNKFNQPIECDHLYLEKLNLSRSKFNQHVNNLPPSLKILILPNEFNQPVENLPCAIEILQFGKDFNNSVDFLPNSLKELYLGENFSQSLDNLPNCIKFLSIRLNKSVSNIKSLINLPISIKKLSFDYDGDKVSIKNKIKIAHSVKEITINNKKMIDFFDIGPNTQFIFSK